MSQMLSGLMNMGGSYLAENSKLAANKRGQAHVKDMLGIEEADMNPFIQHEQSMLPMFKKEKQQGFADLTQIEQYANSPESSPWTKMQIRDSDAALQKYYSAIGLGKSGAMAESLSKTNQNILDTESNKKESMLLAAANSKLSQSNYQNPTFPNTAPFAEMLAQMDINQGDAKAQMWGSLLGGQGGGQVGNMFGSGGGAGAGGGMG